MTCVILWIKGRGTMYFDLQIMFFIQVNPQCFHYSRMTRFIKYHVEKKKKDHPFTDGRLLILFVLDLLDVSRQFHYEGAAQYKVAKMNL